MKNLILTIFAALTVTAAGAWPSVKEAPFKSGEKLSYQVSYRAALVPNTVVADVKIITNVVPLDDSTAYHVWANARVMSFFRWFYDLNDTYEVWLAEKTLLPLKFANDLKEGKYLFKSSYTYDWKGMKVSSVSRNAKWTEDRLNELEITPESMDPLSTFYNMRGMDISSFQEGEERPLHLVFSKKIRHITFKFLGRENYSIKKLGKFRTLKFSCQLVNEDGESFEDGSEFFIWITDDQNKIPIYLESPIKVGSIRATITKMENLKYPLDSKIK